MKKTMLRTAIAACAIALAGCSAVEPGSSGSPYGGSLVPAGDDVCAGILPSPAVKNQSINIDLSVLAEQLFRTELDAEYESEFFRLLDDDTLRDWVFLELGCQIANASFEDEERRLRFFEMQYLARTNPEALIQWVKENPAGGGTTSSMIEVREGVCDNWRIIFSQDGGVWLHGDWIPSDTTRMIPRENYAAHMERMECVKRS